MVLLVPGVLLSACANLDGPSNVRSLESRWTADARPKSMDTSAAPLALLATGDDFLILTQPPVLPNFIPVTDILGPRNGKQERLGPDGKPNPYLAPTYMAAVERCMRYLSGREKDSDYEDSLTMCVKLQQPHHR